MNSDFPRVITLLRKEKKISQKKAADGLEVSQALLSHYENGRRECGLDFVIRCAKFYGVTSDYLLGLSPDRNGVTISVEDIPETDGIRENTLKGSMMPTLNKKLIVNSLNIIFDILRKVNNKNLTNPISSYLMFAVYNAFRTLYSIDDRNEEKFFAVSRECSDRLADAMMDISRSSAASTVEKELRKLPKEDLEALSISSESLMKDYPLFATSLSNLVQNCESKITKTIHE